jgi:UDP-2-acetamido-2,6-beta-L-arabino-hexul-4-ose reductase
MQKTILVTGATGLLGTHLIAQLKGEGAQILVIDRTSTADDYASALMASDVVAHLAGVTNSPDPEDFKRGNVGTTARLAEAITLAGRPLPILFASSIRVATDTLYGRTKRAAEDILLALHASVGSPVAIFRLPSFFGTWSRPDYNSALATFCHQAATGRPIVARTPEAPLQLVTLDTAVGALVGAVHAPPAGVVFPSVTPVYETSVAEVTNLIGEIARGNEPAGSPGLVQGLRLTYRAHAERAAASG